MQMLRNIGTDASLAVFVLLMLFSCRYVKGDGASYQEHAALLDKLFLDYDKVSRPSPDPMQSPVNVTLGIAVAQLVKVDERMEGMNLNVWYRMAWKDYRLEWDPREHGNITNFKVDSDYLWTPDIMLCKPLTSEAGHVLGVKKHDDDLAWKISVSSDGTASFNFPGSIYGQCSLTISDYPYDEHKCSFVFSSWVHDGSELILKLRPSNSLDFGNYVHNNEWHIVGKEPKAIEKHYACCPAPHYMTSFNIHIRRGASSYVSNYIIPSILIAILSIMMFTLPPEVGKRMEIGINLLLCLSVYLTILNTKMPTRSDAFPLLSKFYGCCIFILTCALLCTCWVVAYYFHDMSGWKVYAMSQFVEVGVLKHLRRALRFPNATKVYPSDILESVNSQRMIEVKPMTKEKTNFSRASPTNSPNGVPKPAKIDTKVVTKENENKKPVEKPPNNVEKKPKPENENKKPVEKPPNNVERKPKPENGNKKPVEKPPNNVERKWKPEYENEKPVEKPQNIVEKKPKPGRKESMKQNEEPISENKKREKTLTEESREREKKQEKTFTKNKDTDGRDEKHNGDDQGKADNTERKKAKKRSKENLDNTKLKEDPAPENDAKNSKKIEKKEVRKDVHKKRDKSEVGEGGAVEKKPKPSMEDKRRESDTSQNIRNSRSASRDSNTSETSKKSNNIFADTVAPGLAERPKKERRRKKPKKEDLGVVNMGADNEEEKSKEIGNKNEKDGNEEDKKVGDVREAPSLKDKTEETAGDEKASEKASALAKKPPIFGKTTALPALDQSFDAKQESKKKHDSIKLLKELSEYFSDHLERKKNRYQWRQAAVVLNRLFLIILCISIAMSIILVFLVR